MYIQIHPKIRLNPKKPMEKLYFSTPSSTVHWSMRRLSHHYFEDDRIYILCGYRNLNHVNHECPFYIFSWHSATNYKVCPFHSGTVRKASRVGKLSTKLCESFGLDRQCLRFQHSSLSSGTMYRMTQRICRLRLKVSRSRNKIVEP